MNTLTPHKQNLKHHNTRKQSPDTTILPPILDAFLCPSPPQARILTACLCPTLAIPSSQPLPPQVHSPNFTSYLCRPTLAKSIRLTSPLIFAAPPSPSPFAQLHLLSLQTDPRQVHSPNFTSYLRSPSLPKSIRPTSPPISADRPSPSPFA